MKYIKQKHKYRFGKWLLLIMLLMVLLPVDAISKSKIYYVAGSTSKANQKQKEIIVKITDALKKGLGDMWIGDMNNQSWNDNDARKSLLGEQKTDYVLMMDEWRVNEAKRSFEMKFKLLSVKNGHFTESIWWYNNDYRFTYLDGQAVNLEKFAEELSTDIDLYVKSSDDPTERKFRPRIKIDSFESEIADFNKKEFIEWLNDELNSKYAISEESYKFYYSSKKSKIYPENSLYTITGVINKSTNDGGGLLKIDITIAFPDDDTELSIDLGKEYKNDKWKKVVVDNFDNSFNKDIQYYGK